MESLIKKWDGESVIIRFDKETGSWIFIAIHSTKLGPAIGGTRMKQYPDLKSALLDAMRLAGGMTYKWASAGLEGGGGKAVIAIPADLDSETRSDLLRRYGAFIKNYKGLFLTGPDLGTTTEDMDVIAEFGNPYVFGRTLSAGGGGNPAPFTALGVFTSIQVTSERLFGSADLSGKKILIQGVGSVGKELIGLLHEAQAEVTISDVNKKAVDKFKNDLGLESIDPDEVYGKPCDIFAPCAVGGIVNEETIALLACQAIVGAANNQLALPEDATRLKERQILYSPDFVANSGGAIALIGMETKNWPREEAKERLVQAIKDNLSKIYELAETEDINTDEAARRLADKRLA